MTFVFEATQHRWRKRIHAPPVKSYARLRQLAPLLTCGEGSKYNVEFTPLQQTEDKSNAVVAPKIVLLPSSHRCWLMTISYSGRRCYKRVVKTTLGSDQIKFTCPPSPVANSRQLAPLRLRFGVLRAAVKYAPDRSEI